MKETPLVAIAIIARNEEKALSLLLHDLSRQTYPHNCTLVVLIDSSSEDATKRVMLDYAGRNDMMDVICGDNPGVIQSCGWNAAFDAIDAYPKPVDIVIRVDAHIRLHTDFVEKNVDCILSGQSVCGGSTANCPAGNSLRQRLLCSADNAVFGAGIFGAKRNSHA